MLFNFYSIFIFVFCIRASSQYGTINQLTENSDYSNYEQLYRKGVDAYLENNFRDCVKYIEDAISEYKEFNRIVNECRLGCKNRMYAPIVPNQDPHFKHYEALIQETLCLMNCKRGKVHPNRIEEIKDKDLVKDFEDLKTYDYLQLCYFQTQEYVKAANSAYTNLLANPDHKIMKENVAYYLGMDGVDKDSLVDLEQPEFYGSYLSARLLYNYKHYDQMIPVMERALKSFFQEEDICRVQCEKPFDMGWFPDFVSSVSNHFTFCLKCKLNCATKLHTASGIMDEELLASMFDYLQFSYFKVDNYEQALSNALTYIRFRGEDKVMANNVAYYRVLLNGTDGKVRSDALHYIEREEDELALLHYIEKSFSFPSEILEANKNTRTASIQEVLPHEKEEPSVDEKEVLFPSSEFRAEANLLSPPPVITFEP